jgi:hypothetical protein
VAKRGSLSGCKVDADTPLYSAKPKKQQTAEKEYISKHKKNKKIDKMKESYSMYLQQQQTSGSAAQPRPVPAGGAPC